MKKILILLSFILFSFASIAQICPPGQQNQIAAWRFLKRQCFDSSAVFKGIGTEKVAYIDANGVVTTISMAALLDSLDVPVTDSSLFATRHYVDSLISLVDIFVTPQQFGATGTGNNNDSRAFQDAVNSFTDSNIYIYVPGGTYRIDTSVMIVNKKAVKFWGPGKIVCNQDTGAAINITGNNGRGQIEFGGLTFDFANKAANNVGLKIYGRRSDKVYIHDCSFSNFGDTGTIGILFDRASIGLLFSNITVVDCWFYNDVADNAVYNFNIKKKGRAVKITGETQYGLITGCSFVEVGTAIWLEEAANWNMLGNMFLDCRGNIGSNIYEQGVIHVGNTGSNNAKFTIAENKFNHLEGVAIFSDYGVSTFRPLFINNNEFIANGAPPIFLRGKGHLIIGNFFDRGAELPGNVINNPFPSDTARTYITLISSDGSGIYNNAFTYSGDSNMKYAAKTITSNNTSFQNNRFLQGGLAINIPDAVSYIDTTQSGNRYFNNGLFLTPPTVTGSATTSAFSIRQTWNTTGNPTGIFMNITNTASGGSGNLMDLQVGGSSRFRVSAIGEGVFASTLQGTAVIATSATNGFIMSNRFRITSEADGIVRITDNTQTGFNRFQLGGTTSSFPALRRSGDSVHIYLADGSGFTKLRASYFGANTIAIGATPIPNASAALTITSTTQGFLPPVMTATQGSAIASPATGLLIYVTDTNGTFTSTGWWGYNGATWEKLNN